MIFNEALYFAFLAAAALAYAFLPRAVRPWWLFACGLALYAYYSPAFVWLLAVELALVWVLTRASARPAGGRAAFLAALALALGVLAVFKYAGLASDTLGSLARLAGAGELPTFPQLYLPLAISFFTFEFVHYAVDARKGELPAHSLADFLAFAMFFPTMVAGPIKRFQHFQPQLDGGRPDADDVWQGVLRIAVGAAKKIVIADTMTPFTAPLLSGDALAQAGRVEILAALLAFSVKIYFDFSGYSDIAIGSARLFGIRVPENFAWPYLRADISSFWRHWHMSLTSWISDYVYIPLGGNRKGLPRTAANLLLAMLVSGLWHGAAWHFVAWGGYHGVLLAGHRVWRAGLRPRLEGVPALRAALSSPAARFVSRPVGAALTFGLVTLGWGLFVMPVDRFVDMLGRLV